MACYIYQLPSWVLDDLCRNIDTLSEWDWMQFASYVITDLTQLRKIKSMERVQGVSITRELLWWWSMRQATVQQLVDLLRHLELYRAAQIVLSWKPPVPESTSPLPTFPEAVKPGPGPVATSRRNLKYEQEKGQPMKPHSFLGAGTTTAGAQQQASCQQPCEGDAPCSLKPDVPVSPQSKCGSTSTSVPKQEKLLSLPGGNSRLFWSEADVVQATEDFDQSHRISEGTFADIYRGQRNGVAFAFKKLREAAGSSPGSMDRFLQAEMQLCLRCCHPNVLPLLGFCTGRQFHSLIYPYMANGSLQDRLWAQGDSDMLPWPQRASICSGLLLAVEHLHSLDIIHSNVKSANVLLDQHLNPKLAHPVAHPCPDNKKTKYTVMKTHLFQASAAYLPENFIRVGQLTKQVDIFSCGIVLAEVLTGIPAVDKDRSPVYLDLLLREIPSSTSSVCSRKTGMEKTVVKEICRKHVERRAGLLPEACEEAWATAVSVCLRRRHASVEEARVSMAGVEERLRGQLSLPWSRVSDGTGSSSNTPEETDDVDNSSFSVPSSVMAVSCPRVASSPFSMGNGTAQPSTSGRQEANSSSEACTGPQPPQDATETSWKIEINDAKRKLMENILLYKEEKLDSIELFGP
ncbi:interleukin-1 receptor-associated kinase-like 2 isoform X2 [Mastomys coucha]|uniref:interleukin-1 receptor-associated kinase-like 2 isoform X2 n=1 Tax=Mastomys coucha TaxID=35658 RepID=UPI00126143B6|nr:interleukin-1 receptor-associated kinase-like 2 isoform X2 [Mastomys coucha]